MRCVNNDPPYCLFPYVADATDKPPLNYTKVCPVGGGFGFGGYASGRTKSSTRFVRLKSPWFSIAHQR